MRNAKKITSILIAASLTMVLFSGCASKAANVATTTNVQTSTTGNGNNKKFDPAAMKTSYETALKSLVTEGTITQDQSDKVLEAVTKVEIKPSGTAPTDGKKPSDTAPADRAKSAGTKPKNDRLSALVTSAVITQVQADTINQKLRESMKNSQSTQTKQN